jgi:16S rRNA (adenine1518-N6/adenine1519-N6)-dimethyltransferase
VKAKKSYGQHFLTSDHIAERIAHSLELSDTYSHILEVGPGQGMLTKFLLQLPQELKVVEADQDMVEYLRTHYPELEDRIVSADFLKLPLDKVMEGFSFGLIGNFPYNISSQIVFRMLKYRDLIPEMVGMFQREMAERIVSEPGSKDYGVISVLTQAFYTGQFLFGVKPGSFNPPPKVQSAVIRLERKPNQDIGCDPKLFRQVVKLAFSQRRKMLRNTIKSLLKGDPILKDPIFQERPEQLSVQQFVDLTNLVSNRLQLQDNNNDQET